jgi:hypothetical protein
MYRGADYWVGYLSHTVAVAVNDPHPERLLRPALKEFLADRPPGDGLAADLRRTLKEKT